MATGGPHPSIVMTPPPPNKHMVSSHPRRIPAKNSVSLLHSFRPPPSRLNQEVITTSTDSDLKRSNSPDEPAGTDSPSSLEALRGKDSSGETSNAENWFEKSNNEVRKHGAAFTDDDPPFFFRRSSSSETPPDLRPQWAELNYDDTANSLPLRTGLLQLGTDGSSTEDFRSVIDDLTIENKKLKRRLKKYEKLHDSHLKDEKLFEVRIHGLPAEKKRELEDTLRKFASSLGPSGLNAFPPNGYASLMPMLNGAKTSSSQTSLHNADSAYASMSASGQGSSAQSGPDVKHRMTPSQYPAARRQNIQNYLHHIPEGLLPQENPATMSERAKKKLVVRRMEQIFAGKGAADGGNQQSIQQQEVSQSAARSDRSTVETTGQRARQEGSREAHIMNRETEDPMDVRRKERRPVDAPSSEQQQKEEYVGEQDFAEQRPTRPLDLDPQRAQVPAENIRYLRQMGFSPDPQATKSAEEGHGWIYLNFLINMAQLHTINVTSEFVRKALSEYSKQFELSDDGRRVRWKGGNSITRTTSSGETSLYERDSENTPDPQSPRKRLKLSHEYSSSQVGGASQRLQSENSKHAYTPLFFHREDSEEEEDSSEEEEDDDSASSPFPAPAACDSSAFTSSGVRTTSGFPLANPKKKRKQKHDDGPIIFYNNARFCTDLSGDRNSLANYNAPAYSIASSFPIGRQRTAADEVDEKRGPLVNAKDLPEPMDLTDNPIPDHMELTFPERSPPRPHSSREHEPVDLEVTGIGGVWPADNLSISVEARHARIDQQQAPDASARMTQKPLPQRFAKVLRASNSSHASQRVQKEVVSSIVQELPPSELPPALNFMPFGEESEDEDESDIDEEDSELHDASGALPPATAPQPVEIPYASTEEDSEVEELEDDDDDEESDGEVDFLAGVRAIDPEAVRQQEREYEAHMAERLAEEIPAGSSAATAGGGSGFASPASGVTRGQHKRAMREHRQSSVTSMCARASDSMVVNGREDSSDSSSDGDSDDDEEMSNARS